MIDKFWLNRKSSSELVDIAMWKKPSDVIYMYIWN